MADGGSAAPQLVLGPLNPSVPPGGQAADFAEYCFLYRAAWSEPAVRWLLSVIPTAMVFDDHDVHDDWNISAAWRREYRAKPWWRDKIRSAVYQAVCSPIHNLLPARFRRGQQVITSHAGELGCRLIARLAGVGKPGVRWRVTDGPWFHNMLAAVDFDGRTARIRFARTAPAGATRLQPVCDTGLSAAAAAGPAGRAGHTQRAATSPGSAV